MPTFDDDDDGMTVSRKELKKLRSEVPGSDDGKKEKKTKKQRLGGAGGGGEGGGGGKGISGGEAGRGGAPMRQARERVVEDAGAGSNGSLARKVSLSSSSASPVAGWKSTKVVKGGKKKQQEQQQQQQPEVSMEQQEGEGEDTRWASQNGEESSSSRDKGGDNGDNGKKTVHGFAPGSERAKLHEQREALPISKAAKEIIWTMKRHDTLVLVGETGSGKTTQLPQFIRDAGLAKRGAIAVTQPRRVAAIMVATRVAYESDVKLGEEVGYSVRFDDKSSSKTKIKFLTDGMLVRELMLDNTLKRYGIIVLDEAHERTLNTEVLFALIKRLQISRSKGKNPLRVVVMSATLEAKAYADFFLNSKVLHVPGRRFPVKVMYTSEPQPDVLDATIVAVLQIHLEEPRGDILVFMTGQDQIEDAAKVIRERGRALPPSADKLLPCPLYAAMPPAQQLLAFEPAPAGTRKVILATNIAESSITVEGIMYVVDGGLVKARIYDPKMDMDLLHEVPVSKAQAQQRTGRAGRMAAGKCFRLYQEEGYEELSQSAVPEIKRCRLSSMVLQLKVIGVDNFVDFEFMDPPPKQLMVKAMHELHVLGAMDQKMKLTELGKRMSMLPLEPQYAKLLLSSGDFACSEEILTVVAMLSVESIFYTPANAREDASRARSHLISTDGDHITYLLVYDEWVKHKRSGEWCKQTYVNSKSMQRVYDVRKQLKDYLAQVDIPSVSCGDDYSKVRRCLVTALFGNAARLSPDGYTYKLETTAQTVLVHPTSALFQRKPECVVFDQLLFTTKLYMRHCTVIDAEWLVELVPQMYKVRRPAPPGAKELAL